MKYIGYIFNVTDKGIAFETPHPGYPEVNQPINESIEVGDIFEAILNEEGNIELQCINGGEDD